MIIYFLTKENCTTTPTTNNMSYIQRKYPIVWWVIYHLLYTGSSGLEAVMRNWYQSFDTLIGEIHNCLYKNFGKSNLRENKGKIWNALKSRREDLGRMGKNGGGTRRWETYFPHPSNKDLFVDILLTEEKREEEEEERRLIRKLNKLHQRETHKLPMEMLWEISRFLVDDGRVDMGKLLEGGVFHLK